MNDSGFHADVIVVGSGAAGVWAAFQAAERGLDVLVLDVGLRPGSERPLVRNLYDLRRDDEGQAAYLIGNRFESLHNLHGRPLSPKLKSPRFRYVTDAAESLGAVDRIGFDPVQSFSYGGLANAWGAGAYRYTEEDLSRFPLELKELEHYYDTVTRCIGLCGCADDLGPCFGPSEGLQPPLKLDRLSARMLDVYGVRRARFQAAGIMMGRPRLAILSRAHEGRSPCAFDNLSCWQPDLAAIYSPAMTLDRLVTEGKVRYQGGRLVESFREIHSGVHVSALHLDRGVAEAFNARAIILAAGAINSSRIVLRSMGDTRARQPLLENPTSLTPLLHPAYIGRAVDRDSHGLIQLNLIYRGPLHEDTLQGSFYSYTSPLASDLCQDFPLAARGSVVASRYLLPAMALLQLYYPDRPSTENYVQLKPDGRLTVRYGSIPHRGTVERHIIRVMRRAGFLSHPAQVRYPEPGSSIHYAGTLPMSTDASIPYRTSSEGRLCGSRCVFVADSAVFPVLPAKNHTLTIMANAMRTADHAATALGGAAR